MNRAQLKQQAKQILGITNGGGLFNTKMVNAFLACLVLMAISGVASVLTNRFAAISFLVQILLLPFQVALCSYFIKFVRNENPKVSEAVNVSSTFGAYLSAMLYQLLKIFLAALPATILFIVSMVIVVISAATQNTALVGIGSILLLVSLILYIISYKKILLYSMVPYIIADNSSLSGKEACARSAEMMEGHQWEYLVLQLSFFLWGLLCIFIFPVFFVLPYMQTTDALYYQSLCELR